MIADAEDYFANGCGRCERFATPDCSTRKWADGLRTLRRICRDAGLVETAKWGHPCYMHAGRNIVILNAFRRGFHLNFLNAALMKDPEGLLEKQGPNSQTPSAIPFTDASRVAALEPVIRSYLHEAMAHAEAGRKPAKAQRELDLPEELTNAFDADPDLAEAFNRLTPGRQKSYVISLNSAKKAETRLSRIAGFRTKIIAGKGALDR